MLIIELGGNPPEGSARLDFLQSAIKEFDEFRNNLTGRLFAPTPPSKHHDNYPLTICFAHANVSSESEQNEMKKEPKTRNLIRHSKPIGNTRISLTIKERVYAHSTLQHMLRTLTPTEKE